MSHMPDRAQFTARSQKGRLQRYFDEMVQVVQWSEGWEETRIGYVRWRVLLLLLMLHGLAAAVLLCELVSESEVRLDSCAEVWCVDETHLSWTLKSSSTSSSSQLSSHSLSPPDFAAPGAAPLRCARSVCESSQSNSY